MLETIREFALERLSEAGEEAEIRRGHVEYFLELAEEAEPHLVGGKQKEWLDRLERDHENMRAVLGWALEEVPEAAAHIANALWRFWDMRGHVTEGRRWLSRLLEGTKLSRFDRMRSMEAAALLADLQDDYPTSISYGQEALSLARELGSTPDVARALIHLGSVALRQGDLEHASSAIEEAVALSETVSDPHLVVRALNNLATLRSDQQRTSEALRYTNVALRFHEARRARTGPTYPCASPIQGLSSYPRPRQHLEPELGRCLASPLTTECRLSGGAMTALPSTRAGAKVGRIQGSTPAQYTKSWQDLLADRSHHSSHPASRTRSRSKRRPATVSHVSRLRRASGRSSASPRVEVSQGS